MQERPEPYKRANRANHFHHGLYEVHLPVRDLKRSVDFYSEKLGFSLGFGNFGGTSALLLYSDGNTRWMLGLFQVDVIVRRRPAEYHVSFRIAENDADQMVDHLRERGIDPVHPPAAPLQGPMQEPIVHGWMPAAAVFLQGSRWASARANRGAERRTTT